LISSMVICRDTCSTRKASSFWQERKCEMERTLNKSKNEESKVLNLTRKKELIFDIKFD
jgi:hypothetical protein